MPAVAKFFSKFHCIGTIHRALKNLRFLPDNSSVNYAAYHAGLKFLNLC